MSKEYKEFIFSLVLSLTSLLLTIQSFCYSEESSVFPRFITALMTFFAVLLSVKNYAAVRKSNNSGSKEKSLIESIKQQKMPCVIFCATLLYLLGIRFLGYFSSTVIFLVSCMIFLGKRKNWKVIVLSTSGFLLVVYALFVWFLNLKMPHGFLI